MPWSNQGGGGGGPWGGGGGGGGGQNPWGSRGGGSPQGPDLEAMLRRGQDRMKRLLPKGFGGGKGIILIGALLFLIWMASGFYFVQEDQQGVVTQFGAHVRDTGPGLHYHLPAPIEAVETPSVTRINRLEVGFRSLAADGRTTATERDVPDESLMLTGDQNIIDIDFSVLWRIRPDENAAANFLFNIRDPEETVRAVAESAMREAIGQTDIQPALTQDRSRIEEDVRLQMQEILDDYESGILITQVQLLDSAPPGAVVEAFENVLRARQDLERLRNEAEAYANRVIPEARGEAEQIDQVARAYRDEVIAGAQGDARRFLQVLESYQVAPEITARRLYIETIQDILADTSKFIVDPAAVGGSGVLPYLPLNEIQRRDVQTRQGG